MNRKKGLDMTQGPIAHQLILYAIPLLLGDLLQQFYNTADSAIVGNFISKQALAAVGATASIVNILVGLFTGISTGATVVISRNFGAKNTEMLTKSVHTVIWLTILLGIAFTGIGMGGTPLMLGLLGTPADVLPAAKEYLLVYFAGISGLVLYNMCSGILRAVGDTRRPLFVLIFSSVLNIILDLVFILSFGMGVGGAALATVISQFLSAAVLIWMLKQTPELGTLHLRKPDLTPSILRQIISIGLPVGLQKSVISFSNTVVVSYINKFESGAMAAWSIHMRLDQIITHTMQDMSIAATTFVAQNAGAQKPERIRAGSRTALGITWTMCALCRYPGLLPHSAGVPVQSGA